MNHPILRGGLCILSLTLAATALASGSGTLFPSNEFGISLFGESATGNVHLETRPTVVNKSTTVSVLAPSAPKPPPTGGGTVTVAARPAFRFAAALKGLTATDPSVTTTTHRVTQHTHIEHDGGGGGVQLSWFFSRYTGVAIEGDFLGGATYLTQLTGQFILRYPFDFGQKPLSGYSKDDKAVRSGKDSKDYKGSDMSPPTWGLAPYAIFGGGAQWDGRAVGIADVGGGLELRFLEHWAIYTDARWIVRNGAQHYTAVRTGIAYNF
jgi:hypothetical protein